MKPEIQKRFESAMFIDIQNLEWDEELEMYVDPTTQLCWLTWLTFDSIIKNTSEGYVPEGYILVKKRKPLTGNPNVDFSVAPKWANYWLKDGHSNKFWWCSNRPKLEESYFLFHGRYSAEEAPSFGFNGDWKNSMTSKKAIIEEQEPK